LLGELQEDEMKISELLAQKGSSVATVNPDSLVSAAVEGLTSRNVGALVVSVDDKTLAGIVSERDIVRAIHARGSAVLDEPVSSIMSSDVHTCSPDDSVESLMAIMTERRVRHLPVLSSGELAGMVSIGDVVKNRMDELEHDNHALVDYINAR
jgi:CBS domain-containing protein